MMPISQLVIDFLQGLVGFIAILAVLLTIFFSTRSYQRNSKKDTDRKLADVATKAKEETRSELAFKHLEDAVNNMNTTLSCMNENLTTRLSTVEQKTERLTRYSGYLRTSMKAMHNRMDDHRIVDHDIPKQYVKTSNQLEQEENNLEEIFNVEDEQNEN